MYQLPSPFRRSGDDWSALFNKDDPSNLRISLVGSCRLGGAISCVCFSKDGEYLAAAAYKKVTLFETRSGTEIAAFGDDTPNAGEFPLRPHVYNICFGPNGYKDLLTAAESEVITLWDISSRSVAARFVGHESKVCSLQVPRVGPSYLVVSMDTKGSVKLWDMRSAQALLTLKRDGKYGYGIVAISPNGEILATSTALPWENQQSAQILFWNTKGELLQRFEPNCAVTAMAFSPNGKELVTTGSESIRVWRIYDADRPRPSRIVGEPGNAIISDAYYSDDIRGVAYSSNGAIITTAHRIAALFWSVQARKATPLAVLRYGRTPTHFPRYECIPAFVPGSNSELFATGDDDGRIRIWELSENRDTNPYAVT
jgi:WD40 repeat protein